ncbi:Nn.00g025710.m01.CDS01 [Neocucurbitaria sp. VM-36]
MSNPRYSDSKRNNQRQFRPASEIMSRARSQAPSPRQNVQVGVRSRATLQEPSDYSNSSNGRVKRPSQRGPFKTRIDRDGQTPQVGGGQMLPEQKQATRKRGRSDQGEHEPTKKARVSSSISSTYATRENRGEPVSESCASRALLDKVSVDKQIEEARRASRAKRFASWKTPVKAKPIDGTSTIVPGECIAPGMGNGHGKAAPARDTIRPGDEAATAKSNASDQKSHISLLAKQGENSDTRSHRNGHKDPGGEVATSPHETTERPSSFAKNQDDRKNASSVALSTSSPWIRSTSLLGMKRPRVEAANSEEQSCKKLRLDADTNGLPTADRNDNGFNTKAKAKSVWLNDGKPELDIRNHSSQVPRTAPVIIPAKSDPNMEQNFECKLEFLSYGGDSVPIMYSTSIKHGDDEKLITEPSLYLRQDALTMLARRWTSNDLGRTNRRKTEPTRTIDDCDLYFRNGKVYVATERGLLLAADYIRLIGIPDTQPVRFNGRKPAWTKVVEGRRHYRRVEESCTPGDAEQSQGLLELMSGSTVMVFERLTERFEGKDVELAYGMRLDTGAKGWFPYDLTCPVCWGKDPPEDPEANGNFKEEIVDWTTYSYSRLAAIAAVATPVTPPAQAMHSHTPQVRSLATKSLIAPVTVSAHKAFIGDSNKKSTTDSSSTAIPQQNREMQPADSTATALGETNRMLTKMINYGMEGLNEERMSVDAGMMGISPVKEKSTAAECEKELDTQEFFKEPESIDEAPNTPNTPNKTYRYNLVQIDDRSGNGSSEGDELVAKYTIAAQKEDAVEQSIAPPRHTIDQQRCDRYAVEDEVDYSDGEL